MIILALDTATHCGWASWNGRKMTSGLQEFKLGRGESPGMRFLRFRKWIREMIDLVKPDLICYERSAHFKGMAAAECHHGFQAELHTECARVGLNVMPVQNSALKKHATGKGNAGKDMMIEAARERWVKYNEWVPGELTHDEADALCLLSFAIDELGSVGRDKKIIRVRMV